MSCACFFKGDYAIAKKHLNRLLEGNNDFKADQFRLLLARTHEALGEEDAAQQISENHDLALLQIVDKECPAIQADSAQKLQFGQKLFTIGNPEGLRHSVTAGVLSGRRTFGEEKFIQTDAPINPGNSGGPLINEAGSVIGINTARHAEAEGIGFDIPIETALDAFADILAIKI